MTPLLITTPELLVTITAANTLIWLIVLTDIKAGLIAAKTLYTMRPAFPIAECVRLNILVAA